MFESGGLVLPAQDNFGGIKFTKSDVEKYTQIGDHVKSPLDNPMLYVLARHPDYVPAKYARDQQLLSTYVDAVTFLGMNCVPFLSVASSFARPQMRHISYGSNVVTDGRRRVGPIGYDSLDKGNKQILGIKASALETTVQKSVARA